MKKDNNQQKISNLLVYAATFLIPFYFLRFSLWGIKTNIFELAVLFSLITTTLFVPGGKRSNTKQFLIPALFLIFVLVVSLFSPDRSKSLGIFKGWFLMPAIYAWIVRINFNIMNVKKLTIPLFLSLLIVSVWSILQYFELLTTLFYQRGDASFNNYLINHRAFGPFESPNFLAMFLVPVFFMTLPLLSELKAENISTFRRSKATQYMLVLLFVLPIIALFLSGSRGGYIAFIFSGLVYLNYRYINKQKSSSRKPFYSSLFVICLLLLNLIYLYVSSKVIHVESSSDTVRIEIYNYSYQLLKSNPIFGIGLGNFQNAINNLSLINSFREFGLPYALHPHNLMLAMWLNLGVIGLGLFLYVLVIFFRNSFNSSSIIKPAVLAFMTAVLVHGLFDTTYFKNDLSALFWLAFSISLINAKPKADIN